MSEPREITTSEADTTVDANGTSLYAEVRGDGPPVLFVAGATGDADDFARVADHLSDTFMVVTYDRRGYSRSPRPAGWTATSVDQQADDAAALLGALDLTTAVVYGNSSGAIISLSLVLRHPHVVRGAILHEPPLMAGLADPDIALGHLRQVVAEGRAARGARGGMEAFLRAGLSDANFDSLQPKLRGRLLKNAETFLDLEFDHFEWCAPEEAALAAVARPVQVMAGTDSPPFFREAAQWLAARLGAQVVTMLGAHTPQRDHPAEVASAVRLFAAGLQA